MFEVTDGDTVRSGAGGEGCRLHGERSGLRSKQDGHRTGGATGGVVGDCQIRISVAVQVANGNLVGLLADGVGGGAGEGSVLVIQQYADGAGGSVDVGVGRDEIRISIPVEIAGGDPEGLAANCIGSARE